MLNDKYQILLLHGPNLNLLGSREPKFYGRKTYDEINQAVRLAAEDRSANLHILQSNHEGGLVDALHDALAWADGVVFNPGGYTSTSISIRDAVSAIHLPVVEVHLSNIYAREDFRHPSIIAPVCIGQISGFGWRSYLHGLIALLDYLDENPNQPG